MASTAFNGADGGHFALDMQAAIKRAVEERVSQIVDEETTVARARVEARMKQALAEVILSVHSYYQVHGVGHELHITLTNIAKL